MSQAEPKYSRGYLENLDAISDYYYCDGLCGFHRGKRQEDPQVGRGRPGQPHWETYTHEGITWMK